jgi:hypothetical protein
LDFEHGFDGWKATPKDAPTPPSKKLFRPGESDDDGAVRIPRPVVGNE